ncbi:hypothetical protein [Mucilaginibacter sp.]
MKITRHPSEDALLVWHGYSGPRIPAAHHATGKLFKDDGVTFNVDKGHIMF